MPDSAVNRNPDSLSGDTAAKDRFHRPADTPAAHDSADTEKKLARAARSAQRLAQLSEGLRSGETLDLFAEDAERAQLQALNTDIRQGTFEGFELPEVFLAAVQSNGGAASAEPIATKRASKASVETVEPVQGLFQDEDLQPRPDACDSAAKPGAIAAAVPRAASISIVALDDAPAPHDDAAQQSERAPSTSSGHDEAAPCAQAVTRHDRAPELDRARATAFADTIDALYAVIAEQRTSAAAHAGRMKTLLTIMVCAMLVAGATAIAQTVVLMHMSRDGKLQQDRMEQLMLNQQATLASLFDTDSATVSLRHGPDARDADGAYHASPMQPVSAVKPDSAPKNHAHHRAGSSTR